jgi:hypothetical protein
MKARTNCIYRNTVNISVTKRDPLLHERYQLDQKRYYKLIDLRVGRGPSTWPSLAKTSIYKSKLTAKTGQQCRCLGRGTHPTVTQIQTRHYLSISVSHAAGWPAPLRYTGSSLDGFPSQVFS